MHFSVYAEGEDVINFKILNVMDASKEATSFWTSGYFLTGISINLFESDVQVPNFTWTQVRELPSGNLAFKLWIPISAIWKSFVILFVLDNIKIGQAKSYSNKIKLVFDGIRVKNKIPNIRLIIFFLCNEQHNRILFVSFGHIFN